MKRWFIWGVGLVVVIGLVGAIVAAAARKQPEVAVAPPDTQTRQVSPSQSTAGSPPSSCQSDPKPVITNHVTDLVAIDRIIPPVWTNARDQVVLNALIYTEGARVPITMPADGALVQGAYYTEQGRNFYLLVFRISCEVTVTFDHITEVTDELAAAFPDTPQSDTRSESFREPKAALKAGASVGFTTGTVNAKNWNVAVNNTARRHDKVPLPEGGSSELYHTVDCPFDYFSTELAAEYRKLLVTKDKDITVPYPVCE